MSVLRVPGFQIDSFVVYEGNADSTHNPRTIIQGGKKDFFLGVSRLSPMRVERTAHSSLWRCGP